MANLYSELVYQNLIIYLQFTLNELRSWFSHHAANNEATAIIIDDFIQKIYIKITPAQLREA
jgi:hypothetical protein